MFLVFSPFCFRDFGSSLLSLLWILTQIGCLFHLHLFGLVGFYLAPLSVTNFFVISFFFFLMGGAVFLSTLLVVWPETSSTGVCRQLDRAGSWCWDEDLQEASLRLIFPGVWGALLVQWFGLGAPTTGAWVWPLAWEPRSCKLFFPFPLCLVWFHLLTGCCVQRPCSQHLRPEFLVRCGWHPSASGPWAEVADNTQFKKAVSHSVSLCVKWG